MIRATKTLLFLLVPLYLAGQPNSLKYNYIINPELINPSLAGSNEALNIGSFYRRVGSENVTVPGIFGITADAPFFNENAGFGFIAIREKAGSEVANHLIINSAYRINGRFSNFSFGLGTGITTLSEDWLKSEIEYDQDNSGPLNPGRSVFPHLSLGVFYRYDSFYAGFSIPELLNYRLNAEENKTELVYAPSNYTYTAITGYHFDILPKLRFSPSTMVAFSPNHRLIYDLNAVFKFDRRFWVGASLRDDKSGSLFLQIPLKSQLRIAYSYGFDQGMMFRSGHGFNEIIIRYEFRYIVDVVDPINILSL